MGTETDNLSESIIKYKTSHLRLHSLEWEKDLLRKCTAHILDSTPDSSLITLIGSGFGQIKEYFFTPHN